MKEILGKMLAELKANFKEKEIEVNNNPNCNSYTQSKLSNSEKQIECFEHSIQQVTNDPTQQTEVLNNFNKNAKQIKLDIIKINCDNN